ncbi:MAG: glycosyltransferase [Verrucomicrobiota bacterium]
MVLPASNSNGTESNSSSSDCRIAVVIAARNAAPHISEALESLARQTSLPDEVIVIDDGSTDETASLVACFGKAIPQLALLREDDSIGISAARNKANAVAGCEFIAVLDADDLFDSNAIRRYRDFLSSHPDTDFVYAHTRVFSDHPEAGRPQLYPDFRSSRAGIRRTLGSPRLPMKHSSLLYRKVAIEKIGGYDETCRIKVDIELFLRCLQNDLSIRKLDAIISYHRRHRHQISTRRFAGLPTYFKLIRRYEPNRLFRGFHTASRTGAEITKFLLRG